MEQIHRIKSSTTIAFILPYTVVDIVTQRTDLWYIWIDNLASIVATVYALLFILHKPSRKIAQLVFLTNATLMLFYIAVYSLYSPGWPMYSAAIALWAFFFAMFESRFKASRNLVIPVLAILLVYNSWFQVELTSSERWLNDSFTLSRVGTALFMVIAIGMISYIADEYQRINLERQKNKDSKISFQNDLFSILAHNIRTPLATLTMQYQLAKMREQETVELSKTEIPLKQLELTINALLDNRKALRSEKKIPLKELVLELSELHGSLQILLEDEVDENSLIEFGLVMALDSFISNALKYDSSPILKISVLDELIFTLSDLGGGMSSVDFHEYGNPVLSKSRGLGIGVHLNKEILSHLGYKCEVGNTADIGLTIRIYRPTIATSQLQSLAHTQFKVLV